MMLAASLVGSIGRDGRRCEEGHLLLLVGELRTCRRLLCPELHQTEGSCHVTCKIPADARGKRGRHTSPEA